jgi:hypothetical protein
MAQEVAHRQAIAALDQNVDAEGKTQAAPRKGANAAAANARTDLAPANQTFPPETVRAPEAEPFGLAGQRRFRGRNSAQMDRRRIGNSRRQANLGALPRRRIFVSVGGTTIPCHCR